MTSHYFDTSPSSGSSPRMIALMLPDITVELRTDRGVFSAERIDAGTKYLLLEAPPPPLGALNALDLGCGYGPIAIALASRAPQATVWAVDVNERAAALCRENARAARLSNIEVSVVSPTAPAGDIPEHVCFDVIWSNPPVRVGKAAMHSMLLHWIARLSEGGHAYLVVHRHLGADSLQRWLVDQHWNARRVGSRAGYRLLDISRGNESAGPL